MAIPLTLAQYRDAVRRWLQIVPGPDANPPEPIGTASTQWPDPDDNTCNQAINNAIASINRIVSTAQVVNYQIPVPVANIELKGVQYVDYTSAIMPPNSLIATQVLNISFSDGVTTERLEPYNFYSASKSYQPFQQYSPGRPMQWIVVGGQLGILPPSQTSGTLYMDAVVGIPPLVSDADFVQFLPVDYQDCIQYLAVSFLSGRQATDVEAMQRGQYFDAMGKQGIIQIVQWMTGYDDTRIAAAQDTLEMAPLSEIRRQVAARGTPAGGSIGEG